MFDKNLFYFHIINYSRWSLVLTHFGEEPLFQMMFTMSNEESSVPVFVYSKLKFLLIQKDSFNIRSYSLHFDLTIAAPTPGKSSFAASKILSKKKNIANFLFNENNKLYVSSLFISYVLYSFLKRKFIYSYVFLQLLYDRNIDMYRIPCQKDKYSYSSY